MRDIEATKMVTTFQNSQVSNRLILLEISGLVVLYNVIDIVQQHTVMVRTVFSTAHTCSLRTLPVRFVCMNNLPELYLHAIR